MLQAVAPGVTVLPLTAAHTRRLPRLVLRAERIDTNGFGGSKPHYVSRELVALSGCMMLTGVLLGCGVTLSTGPPTEAPTELAPPTAAPTLGPTTAPQRVYASISFSTLDYSSLTAQALETFQSEFI